MLNWIHFRLEDVWVLTVTFRLLGLKLLIQFFLWFWNHSYAIELHTFRLQRWLILSSFLSFSSYPSFWSFSQTCTPFSFRPWAYPISFGSLQTSDWLFLFRSFYILYFFAMWDLRSPEQVLIAPVMYISITECSDYISIFSLPCFYIPTEFL